MKHYETIVIVNPNLGDEECKEVIKKFSNLAEKLKGVIVKIDEWGIQRLAYRVKKFDKGFFVLMDYCGNPGLVPEFERELKLDERILKYQSVKIEDNADPNELILREKESHKRESVEAEGEGSGEREAIKSTEKEPAEEVKSNV